jgi:hypothetical protein
MGVAVSNRVVARNGIGRFISDCEQAGEATARKMVSRGAKLSRELAPVGSKHDRRSIPISQSIREKMLSRTSGVWQATARHSLHQEFGTRPHTMYGSPFFRFYWEAMGRMWVPGLFGGQDIINHPGHGPQPFLRPAYEMVMAQAMAIARAEYPG